MAEQIGITVSERRTMKKLRLMLFIPAITLSVLGLVMIYSASFLTLNLNSPENTGI